MPTPLILPLLFACANEQDHYANWGVQYPVRLESKAAKTSLSGFLTTEIDCVAAVDQNTAVRDRSGFVVSVEVAKSDGRVSWGEGAMVRRDEGVAAMKSLTIDASYSQKQLMLKILDGLDGTRDGDIDLAAARATLKTANQTALRQLIASEIATAVAAAPKEPREYSIGQIYGLKFFLDSFVD